MNSLNAKHASNISRHGVPSVATSWVWYDCEENLEQSRITNWNHAAPCVGPLALAGGGLHRD